MTLLETLSSKAKQKNARILLPESEDERVIQAAIEASKRDIAKIFLLGNEELMRTKIGNLVGGEGCSIEFVDAENKELRDKYSKIFWMKRRDKGLGLPEAIELIKDRTVFSMMMLDDGVIDGVVTGAVTPSKSVLSNALKILGPADGVDLVSSFFIMSFDEHHQQFGKEIVFADCAMNVDPDYKELAAIAISTSCSAKKLLGIEPKIAMLSFATNDSNKHHLVEKVKKATAHFKSQVKDTEVVGNIQLDAAMDSYVLKIKHPNSNFTPPANVLIFPNLDSGNIGYKLVQRFANAEAIGPILQGLSKPVNDLSRGCSVEEIINTITVTVNQCD